MCVCLSVCRPVGLPIRTYVCMYVCSYVCYVYAYAYIYIMSMHTCLYNIFTYRLYIYNMCVQCAYLFLEWALVDCLVILVGFIVCAIY